LKAWYAQPGDRFEVPVDGYVIDIVRKGELLEIQTGNFAAIKVKLRKLLRNHRIRLIYPIAKEKWIVRQTKDNSTGITRRKSPKKGRVEDLFQEMVSFPYLFSDPNFSLEVLLIKEEEKRRYNGKRRWRRKGWSTEERRLLDVVDKRLFGKSDDLQALLPESLEESFTTKDLAETIGIKRQLAQKMAYCLKNTGVIELIGKQRQAYLYKVSGI
jgi:ribosomal protein S25